MILWVLKNWTWLLPLIAFAGLAVDDGLLRIDYADQKAVVATKDKELANWKAQEAANVAAAEKKVRETMQADIDRGNAIAADKNRQVADLQGRLQDALDAQNKPVDTQACDHTPAADAFDGALDRLLGVAGSQAGGGSAGGGKASRPPGPRAAVPAPSR